MAEIYRRAAYVPVSSQLHLLIIFSDGNLMTDPLPSVPTLDLDSLEDPSEDLEDWACVTFVRAFLLAVLTLAFITAQTDTREIGQQLVVLHSFNSFLTLVYQVV